MVIEIQPLHYGHSDGHTDICYSSDGEKLISCGGDGDVRIWNGFDDDDPLQTCLGEFVLSVKHKNNHIHVATDNNNIQLLTYPAGERDGILTRFTAHVNHIAVGPTHNWIALASEDRTVKVMELTTKDTKTFSGLSGPPLSVALCPKVKHLAVSCGDGKLIIYNVEDQSTIKELNIAPKTNSFINAKQLCRIDFDQKHNKYFAYPDQNKVVILNTSDWSEAYILCTEAVEGAYSIVAFSPCSNYIAATTLDGDFVIWSLRSQSIIGYKIHPQNVAISAIAWNPKGNGDLAFGDVQGYVGLAVKCTDEIAKPDPVVSSDLVEDEASNDLMETGDDVDFGDIQIEDDDDNENAISLEKLKRDIMGPSDGELDNVDNESVRSATPRPRSRTPEIPLQPAFIPSSTPEHLDPRYMCWNEVAVIRCYGSSLDENDDGTRSIEVEFHDSSLHSSMMMSNFKGYTMGSISTGALAVANNNMINVVPLGASSKEWHLNLADDEEIVCIATSHNLICFVTANYLVHVCTIFGIQKAVFAVPGPVITMSAFGVVVLIAYHGSSNRKGDQCVEIMLVKLEGMTIENRYVKTSLAPGAKVQWLGFSDVGTPAIMDSNGMVFLYPLQSNIWIPFCDTSKSKSPIDGFFVTAIYESYGTVRGIRCKGSNYPGFTPRPAVTEIELQPPFIEIDTEKSQFESKLFTWSTLQIDNTTKKIQEVALKSFALAVKNNLDQRAYEVVEMLGNSQVVNLAAKYATRLDKKRIVDKLLELAETIANEEGGTKNVVPSEAEVKTPSNVIKPNRKLMLESTSKILAKTKSKSTTSQITPSPSTSFSENTQDSVSTPSTLRNTSLLNSQDLSILDEEPKNPFLKSLKKPKTNSTNPLSLTDKFAGFQNLEKENKISTEGAEKRKQPDTSPVEKNKEKQRKLDRFLFTKRT